LSRRREPGRARFLLDDGRQPILLAELFPHEDVGCADARADQRPIVLAAIIEEIIEVDRLMRAMKVAYAEMKMPR